jgi:hypothetical protein
MFRISTGLDFYLKKEIINLLHTSSFSQEIKFAFNQLGMLFCIDLNILGGVGEAGARDPKARPRIGFFPFIMVSQIYIELVYFSIHPTFFPLIMRTIQNIVKFSYIKMHFHDHQFFIIN